MNQVNDQISIMTWCFTCNHPVAALARIVKLPTETELGRTDRTQLKATECQGDS